MVTQNRSPRRPRAEGAFGAIADPIRRGILDLLRTQELRAGELAAHFPVSRPAVARNANNSACLAKTGPGASIGRHAVLSGCSVVGEGALVDAGTALVGARVELSAAAG